MKKLLLSFGLIVVFAFYVLLSSTRTSTPILATNPNPVTTDLPAAPEAAKPPTPENAVKTPVPATTPVKYHGDDEEEDSVSINRPATVKPPTPIATPAPIKKPAPITTPSPIVATNSGNYRNGTYTGSVVYNGYGNIQVNAIITGGKISDVQFLQYPNDRSNSIRINTRAMPLLKSEAITAQSASVDGVSGATLTSSAFRSSLAAALALAAN